MPRRRVLLQSEQCPGRRQHFNYLCLGGDVTDFKPFALNRAAGRKQKHEALSGHAVVHDLLRDRGDDESRQSRPAPETPSQWWAGCARRVRRLLHVTVHGCRGCRRQGPAAADGQCFGSSWSQRYCRGHFVSMDANGLHDQPCQHSDRECIRVWAWRSMAESGRPGVSSAARGRDHGITTSGVAPKVSIVPDLRAGCECDDAGERHAGLRDVRRHTALGGGLRRRGRCRPSVTDSYLDRTRALVSITAGTPTLNDAYDVTRRCRRLHL